jgi:hypothetical protein
MRRALAFNSRDRACTRRLERYSHGDRDCRSGSRATHGILFGAHIDHDHHCSNNRATWPITEIEIDSWLRPTSTCCGYNSFDPAFVSGTDKVRRFDRFARDTV